MRTTVSVFMMFCILTSCNENAGMNTNDLPLIRLCAEVECNVETKTETDQTGKSYFVEDDCVGLFVGQDEIPIKWKFNGTSWSADTEILWENKDEYIEFCSFYPYREESTLSDGIMMPDLLSQTGNLSDIGKKDFLVARCVTSYNDNNGVVSFTGQDSFRHICSLLHLEISASERDEEIYISGYRFSGEGIVGSSKYIFGETASDDRIVDLGSTDGSELEIIYKTPLLLDSKQEVAVIVNPVSLQKALEFSLLYKKDGVQYTVNVDLIRNIVKGTYYRLKLNWLNEDKLIVSGSDIKDWDISVVDDIPFYGD